MTKTKKAVLTGLLEDYASHRRREVGEYLAGFYDDADKAKEDAEIVKRAFENFLDMELDD